MKKVELDIISLVHSSIHNHNYSVVLGERHGAHRLNVVIGGFEAQAIVVALERMTPQRPLTHDLLKNVLDTLQVDLKEIIINDYQEGVFYARLICISKGEEIEIDSRTSDAIALAVRFGCPVYTYDFVIEVAGIIIEGEEQTVETPAKNKNHLGQYSNDELKRMLNELLESEDYEQAAKLRDELKNRGL
jgi:uncharacterized protein